MASGTWLAGLFGNSKVGLPEGLPEAWVHQLEQRLAPVDDPRKGLKRPGLARDIAAFVLTGDPLAVLHEIGQNTVVGECLQVLGYHYGGDAVAHLYAHFNQVPNPVALRWARILEASAAGGRPNFKITLPRGVHWPEALLMNTCGHSVDGYSGNRPKARWLSAQQIESLLVEDGLEPSALLVGSLTTPVNVGYGVQQRLELVTDLSGYPQSLERHIEVIRPLLQPTEVPQRLLVLQLLESAHSETLDRLAHPLCELGTSSSKQVRNACEPLLRKCGEAVLTQLQALATEGKPEQRGHALRLIAMLASERQNAALLGFARTTAAADKAPSVQALIKEWDLAEAATHSQAPPYEYVIPVINWDPAANRLPPQLLSELWRKINTSIDTANTRSREHHAAMAAKGHNFKLYQVARYSRDDELALSAYLESDQRRAAKQPEEARRAWTHVAPSVQALAASPGVTPVAVLKLLIFFDLTLSNDQALHHMAGMAFNELHERTGHPSLLELAQMLEDAGFPSQGLLLNYCYSWGRAFMTDWPDEDVWPYFAHNMDLLIKALTHDTIKSYSFDRARLFRAFATLPAPPPAAINALFTLALGPGKTDRLPAQEALQLHPGKEQRIVDALTDTKADTRAVAAQWLGRLRHAPAIAALETAVAKERNDFAKGALLDALEVLGQPVERYLKRESLKAEADKLLSKALPKDLDWFPWSTLPTVRWADNAEPVPAEVLKWLLVQAVKQKLPEPNAVLRKYCSMFDPRDRETLGQFVLETWLQEDVRPITTDEAMSRARATATQTHQWMTKHPQSYVNTPFAGKSVEELTASYYVGLARQPAGSAVACKGLLAVAAACAAERAAAPAQRYLKEWYGSRAAQGKALIAMLAWIEHPSATQLMLAVGSRFRTKSFQEEATRQAQALAERKGWTLAELADRTVPSAGFDESGALELSYGTRQFTARLLADFKIELFNPEGKKIAALPEPRQDDDAESVKAAKKAFGAAKKEIKSIVQMQTERLYEALCTERQWSYSDWVAYLQQHPVLRHLVQRVVWVEVAEGQGLRTFRPLEDGTLTDQEDNEIQLTDSARIQVAHDSLLTSDAVAAWQQHLVDYEISPLFQQLGKGVYSLPTGQAKSDQVGDFQGYAIEAFALRGRALKLGYMRGPTEDGGWFFTYTKRFPTLGLQAALAFTGNGLPEENRTVALTTLSFSGSNATSGANLPLAKVPKVLLSECYNDVRLIAADGSGFDPDWKKKYEL